MLTVGSATIGRGKYSGVVACDCGCHNVFDSADGTMVVVAVCLCGNLVVWYADGFQLKLFASQLSTQLNGQDDDLS